MYAGGRNEFGVWFSVIVGLRHVKLIPSVGPPAPVVSVEFNANNEKIRRSDQI